MTEKKYSLKSNAMHRWLYSRKVDPVIVADRLRMRVSVFKRMIKDKTPFEEEQIRRLVYFMGAKSAFDVIYFATPEERERVRKATFGADENKAHGRENRTKNAQ